MKNFIKVNIIIVGVLLSVSLLSSCEEEPTDALKDIIKTDLGYVPRIARFTKTSPAGTTVPVGSSLNFDLRYWSEGTINDIQFYLIVGTTETQLADIAYTTAFSKITRCDSLLFNYQLPVSLVSGTDFSIQARVANVGLEQYPARSAIALKVQ
jgi:hypothetical protein